MAYNLDKPLQFFEKNGKIEHTYIDDKGEWGNGWMRKIDGFLRHQPFYFASGNHEEMDETGLTMQRFFAPWNKKSKNKYYSVDIGHVHVVVLDSNLFINHKYSDLMAIVKAWLINDLKTTKQIWKVVTLHQPFYCHGTESHCGEHAKDLRYELEPIMTKYKVDLILAGHIHNYERYAPMNLGKPDVKSANPDKKSSANQDMNVFTEPQYPIHVSCGTAGGSEGIGITKQRQQYSGSLVQFGHISDGAKGFGAGICEFTATRTELTFRAILTYSMEKSPVKTGGIADTFTIHKPGKPKKK